MFVIIIILEAVNILVSSKIGSTGSVDDKVRIGSSLVVIIIIPQLQFASVADNQGLEWGTWNMEQ